MKNFFKTILALIVVLAALGGLMWYRGQHSFEPQDVHLEIEAPPAAAKDQEVPLKIFYHNKTKVSLNDVKLFLNNQKVQDLGVILADQKGELALDQVIKGKQGDIKEYKVQLTYQPANFNSEFTSQTTVKIAVNSSPIVVAVKAPEKAVSGQHIEYKVSIFNNSSEILKKTVISLNFPEGFEPDRKQNQWLIEDLSPGKMEDIAFQGVLKGEVGQEKTVKAFIGDNLEAEEATLIQGAPLSFETSWDGRRVVIDYKNVSDLTLKNIEIKLQVIEGDVFDYSQVDIKGGSFDEFAKEARWTPAGQENLSSLQSGEGGQVDLTFKLADEIPVVTNPQLKTKLIITTNQFNLSQKNTFKVPTKIILQAKGGFAGGELPPQVGQKTFYNIHWRLLNAFNEVQDIVVSASLPEGISWKEVVQEQGHLYFNEESQEVVWELSRLPAYTGFQSPVKEVVFQIALTPKESQKEQTVWVLGESILSAQDAFTKTTISANDNFITSDLPDDPEVSKQDGIVQQQKED